MQRFRYPARAVHWHILPNRYLGALVGSGLLK